MKKLPIAVLISGGGSTLKNLLDLASDDLLPIDCRLVVSSRVSATGIDYARAANIPVEVLSRKQFASGEAHRDALFSHCRQCGVELVVMGGYLDHLLIPGDFENRVINVHPSLIPAFCGLGFYGIRVHNAAVSYGVKLSGCTVHFVDNEFDHGPIIAQRTCPVEAHDTGETLQARVGELERELYPEVINAIAQKRVTIRDRIVTLNRA